MKLIFALLATLNFVSLLVAFGAGLWSWSGGSLQNGDGRYLLHFNCGLFAVILNLAVHSIIFIYFLGTGRWVKEVALAYKMPDVPLPKLTRDLKRSVFPPALIAMLVPIAVAAAGAGVQTREWPWYLHGSLATIALLVNLWAYRIEYRDISANARVLDDVIREVDRIRAERGLPSNEEALRQEREMARGKLEN
jgi:hypothetical protein